MSSLDLNIGARVHCKERDAGELLKLVVDPEEGEVTDLVVGQGLITRSAWVLPIALVEKATGQDIDLSIAANELDSYPMYREKEFVLPAPGWGKGGKYEPKSVLFRVPGYGLIRRKGVVPMIRQRVHEGVPTQAAALGRGTRVDTSAGTVGKVDHLLVNQQSGEIQDIVVDTGLLSQSIVVPISMVESIGEEAIVIEGDNHDLAQLPRYRPRADDDILADLQKGFEAVAMPDIELAAEKGIAYLRGVVDDVKAKRHAEATARSVDGVLDVRNALTADTAIVASVTAALSDDPRTNLPIIEVISDRGVVTLKGQVDSSEVRAAAEEIAGRQQGVIDVVNALEVKPDEDTLFLASPALSAEQEPLAKAGVPIVSKLRSP
jgi:sporulation protein YlmC with PRC-barrel domain